MTVKSNERGQMPNLFNCTTYDQKKHNLTTIILSRGWMLLFSKLKQSTNNTLKVVSGDLEGIIVKSLPENN